MSSLYRKWRPQTFSDLKGQDVIRDTIFYALTHDQLSQAYLFCGPRGTGKTTTARLIAKLVNCLAESDAKPCNTCASCMTITGGTNFDILEVDAASNRGIDEIRQLRDSVRFAPTQAKYKVFIIDEVHMLTREAFNALLKTLEEPPAHALFILATTEAHKIPPTIASRCQRYDFRLATPETLSEHLLHVANQEKLPLTPEAAVFVAKIAEGSFRDALSLLEQVGAVEAKEYNRELVEKLFGYIPQEQMSACLEAILTGNLQRAHQEIDAALARGADLKAFSGQLLELSRQALEGLALGDLSGLAPGLGSAVQSVGLKHLVLWIELLIEAMDQMKQSPIPRLPLDVAIAKLGVKESSGGGKQGNTEISRQARDDKPTKPNDPQSVEMPRNDIPGRNTLPEPQVIVVSQKEGAEQPTPVHETVSVPVAVTVPEDISPDDWRKVLEEIKKEAPSLVTSLSHGKVIGITSGVLQVAVRFKMHADKVNQAKNREKIEAALQHVFQAPLKIEAQVVKDLVVEEEAVDITQVFEFED